MGQFSSAGRALALACTLALSGSAAQAQAQTQNSAGSQAALKTLRKEVGAAYDEARRACAKGPAAERAACLEAARQTWQEDLKNAPAQVAAARGMGSVTTTTTRTTGPVTTTTTKIESAEIDRAKTDSATTESAAASATGGAASR